MDRVKLSRSAVDREWASILTSAERGGAKLLLSDEPRLTPLVFSEPSDDELEFRMWRAIKVDVVQGEVCNEG